MTGSRSSSTEDTPNRRAGAESRVLRFDGQGWTGVAERAYRGEDGPLRGVTRRLLARPDEAGFEVRYFEVARGGTTSLEQHDHVHVVLCQRGRGVARLGDALHRVGPGDVVIVAPRDAHQFRCEGEEPFGFVCIVDRERDRPIPLPE